MKRALRYWRPCRALIRVAAAIVVIVLAGCGVQPQDPATAGGGQLFVRVLDEINEFYLEPVSTRRVAIAGIARLARLDNRLAAGDSFGNGGTLALSYEDRSLAFHALPADRDSRAWGALLETVIATARQASPKLAALPRETIDQAVLDGMAGSLDRYSRYASPTVARDQRAAREGYGGIGVTLDGVNDTFRVTAVTPHGPADRAGIRAEDQIVAIDGVTTTGCVHHDVIERLRGPVGSPIAVKVLPAGTAQPRDLRLQRASVFEPTVTASRDGNIAIFRINSFNHSTTRWVAEALAEARRQAGDHLAGVVLDFRGNPGGVLDQAVSLADLFLRDGPIVAAVGRHPASRQYYAASGKGSGAQVPLAVLINGGSASAPEIVAAALQDAGRAVVIGSSSYGKGTVQTVLRLPNNGDLVLTWAHLVAPAGYPLHRHGVVPTICTADLADDPGSVATGLQRAAAGAATRSRATLDEAGWAALRAACPGRRGRPGIDLVLARQVLSDPRLYAEARRVPTPAGQTPAGEQTAAVAGGPRLP